MLIVIINVAIIMKGQIGMLYRLTRGQTKNTVYQNKLNVFQDPLHSSRKVMKRMKSETRF